MKISAIVTLKKEVLDPQGKVVKQTLKNMGYDNIVNIRQGKFFEIEVDEDSKEKSIRTVPVSLGDEDIKEKSIVSVPVSLGDEDSKEKSVGTPKIDITKRVSYPSVIENEFGIMIDTKRE